MIDVAGIFEFGLLQAAAIDDERRFIIEEADIFESKVELTVDDELIIAEVLALFSAV